MIGSMKCWQPLALPLIELIATSIIGSLKDILVLLILLKINSSIIIYKGKEQQF